MSEFTHGPWEVVSTDDNSFMGMTIITPKGLFDGKETAGMLGSESSEKLTKVIAITLHQMEPFVGLDACVNNEDDANANLIAAAPEMFEALKEIEWQCTREGGDYVMALYHCPSCEAEQGEGHQPDCKLANALAKARGQEAQYPTINIFEMEELF